MKRVKLLCFLLLLPVFLQAQTAERVEALLNTDAVSYEQAAQLVLEAADVRVSTGPADAFRYAAEQRWVPGKAEGGDIARLDGISLLIMRAFDLKGGMFYSLFKNPHYAYRELEYQNIIQGRSDPAMDVSGDFLLFMTGRALSVVEGE